MFGYDTCIREHRDGAYFHQGDDPDPFERFGGWHFCEIQICLVRNLPKVLLRNLPKVPSETYPKFPQKPSTTGTTGTTEMYLTRFLRPRRIKPRKLRRTLLYPRPVACILRSFWEVDAENLVNYDVCKRVNPAHCILLVIWGVESENLVNYDFFFIRETVV